jgi:adenylate cyclase
MPAIADFAHKFGLVLKACNLSRGRIAQAVGIDKSVVSRWASGVQSPTDHNLALLTEVIARYRPDFARRDWDRVPHAFAEYLGLAVGSPPGELPLALPERPSIAVLSFVNIAGAPDEAYFADGIAEDIINALSRFKSLFVIARNSSFTYRGRTVDVRQVGRELGVRYVLEGSVRRSGDRVRFTAQLAEAGTASQVWADKYDSQVEDLFDVQDRITEGVVGVLEPALHQAEIERMRRKRPEHFGAYDHFLRGLAETNGFTRESTDAMLASCLKSLAIDPSFAPAYMLAVRAYIQRLTQGWIVDATKEAAEALELIARGLAADRSDALMVATAGQGFAWFGHDLAKGVAHIDEAIALNSNQAHIWMQSGILRTRTGDERTAIDHLERAIRLSPRDLRGYAIFQAMALAHHVSGDAETAYAWACRAVRHNPNYHPAWQSLAASAANSGRMDEARAAAQHLLAREPHLTVQNLFGRYPCTVPDKFKYVSDGLRRAGVPD